MADTPRPGERLTRKILELEQRIRELEQSNPASITINDDDETVRVFIDATGMTTYNADGSVRWQSP